MKNFFSVTLSLLPFIGLCQQPDTPLFRTPAYAIYADRVVQDQFTAKVISPVHMIADYQSPAARYKDGRLSFKFSINGKDNEMPSGTDHHFTCDPAGAGCNLPLFKFGTQSGESISADPVFLLPNTSLVLRVDLRHVFKAFEQQGYYITAKGDKLYKQDFKAVYVAGNMAPMIWDFDNLVNHPDLELRDPDNDHIYEATLILNKVGDDHPTAAEWRLERNISDFPAYHSPYPISDALYNMSLGEMQNAIEQDSTFRTGKEWAGVWTRDISYSILLSMAYLQPAVAMKSLMRKVGPDGRIIQDTGTGGAWPCSTDRMIWAAAAWEIYLSTGDSTWLRQAYRIILHSLEDDLAVNYDPATGLVRGESSFLDWREQTYPRWMQPADIWASECLGTNAVHFRANQVLSRMAAILKDHANASKYAGIATSIRKAINKYLWLPDKGCYAQYLYGRTHPILSPRFETLGEALCILWDIAPPERQNAIIRNSPMTSFGIPCIYPEIPGIPPYHNNAVWPFVETFWTWAAAKAGNTNAVMKGIGDIYRPAALFLTNKENFEMDNGDHSGTQINSSNMLWSLAGNISLVHKVLFGISFSETGLGFSPTVPLSLAGDHTLQNFHYRKSRLNIRMQGAGRHIAVFKIDGLAWPSHQVPGDLEGAHDIYIQLRPDPDSGNSPIKISPPIFTMETPQARLADSEQMLIWKPIAGAAQYQVIKSGHLLHSIPGKTACCHFRLPAGPPAAYQLIALDSAGTPSFASEPLLAGTTGHSRFLQAERFNPPAPYDYKGFTGSGFVETSLQRNRNLHFNLFLPEEGDYLFDFRYANGNGPINTDNKCAIRTLYIDGKLTGTVVLPQRGRDEWSNWGYSNSNKIHLGPGRHLVTLQFSPHDNNMNRMINQAMIDGLHVLRVP